MRPEHNPSGFHPHFSPWLADSEQLSRTLVAHHQVIRDFLARLQGVEQGGAAGHMLVTGPRGIGKTHVLCLVERYVSRRLAIPEDWIGPSAAWVAVLFAEEECAGQNSLANFLLTLLTKLREATPDVPLWSLPADLYRQADQAVVDCCFERLQRFHAERHRRVLVVIDNFQKVLEQWREEDHQRLRSFLSHNHLVVILGSAQAVFRDLIDQRAAFHEFFEIRPLRELGSEEMLQLLSRRFEQDGRQAEFEARRAELARKLPAIEVLTGGNPRLVLFLYQIAARSTFLDIEVALRSLLEEVREYFVRRLMELPDQPRKILDTMAQMPGPATPTEIALAARLQPALVNAQLRRLKRDHYVRPIKLQRQKFTRYDISERLFRIWRQTATVAGRQRFRFLADLLKLYFTPEEVRSLYHHHVEWLRGASGAPLHLEPGSPDLWHERAWRLAELDRLEEALESLERAREVGTEAWRYHHDRGDLLLLGGRFAEALKELEAGLTVAPDGWDLQTDRLIALGCLGEQGPLMEAFPVAVSRVEIPSAAAPTVCNFIYDVALNCLRRGEAQTSRGLFAATLAMKSWQDSEWFGQQAGGFLRRTLDVGAAAFQGFVTLLAERVTNEDVLKLLEPYLKASEFLQTKDLLILERLFPEIRELVLDIVWRVDPGLREQLRRLI